MTVEAAVFEFADEMCSIRACTPDHPFFALGGK
jgi:hypothetical protein